MVLRQGVGPGMAGLRLAAADVAARGAEAKVEGAATLLAAGATRGCRLGGEVFARGGAGTGEPAKDVHGHDPTRGYRGVDVTRLTASDLAEQA